MDEPTKPCRECRAVLPLIDFPKRKESADGHHWLCFDCKRRAARRYARREDVRTARSRNARQTKYGLSPEAFAAKLAEQGGHCPFCPPDAPLPEAWDVDHDHRCCPGHWSCGRCVRDILCRLHNRGLGAFGDDPQLLRAAADYIERHQERIASSEPLRVKAAKSGVGHQAWKGEEAGHSAMRLRVYRAKGTAAACSNRKTAGCTSERYEWVLTPGTNAADVGNWLPLCASCRMALRGHNGGGHFNARLTDEQAAEIRQRYAASSIRQEVLAAEYGVSQAVISEVIRGKSYKAAAGDRAGDPVRQHREVVAHATRTSVSSGALRKRVYRARGPASRCANRGTAACANEHYEWVLTPGADPAEMENWLPLCASCRVSVHGQHGAGNARAKLQQEDADAIRARYAAGGVTHAELAAEYGVTQATISNILLYRRYVK